MRELAHRLIDISNGCWRTSRTKFFCFVFSLFVKFNKRRYGVFSSWEVPALPPPPPKVSYLGTFSDKGCFFLFLLVWNWVLYTFTSLDLKQCKVIVTTGNRVWNWLCVSPLHFWGQIFRSQMGSTFYRFCPEVGSGFKRHAAHSFLSLSFFKE